MFFLRSVLGSAPGPLALSLFPSWDSSHFPSWSALGLSCGAFVALTPLVFGPGGHARCPRHPRMSARAPRALRLGLTCATTQLAARLDTLPELHRCGAFVSVSDGGALLTDLKVEISFICSTLKPPVTARPGVVEKYIPKLRPGSCSRNSSGQIAMTIAKEVVPQIKD